MNVDHAGADTVRRHRILHLSDTHLTRDGVDEDGVDSAAALDRMLHDARLVTGIDLVVVTGDSARVISVPTGSTPVGSPRVSTANERP